jgi:hypothetical protein
MDGAGPDALKTAIPYLERAALSPHTRDLAGNHEVELKELREAAAAATHEKVPELVPLRRVRARDFLYTGLVALAAYLLITKLAKIGFGTIYHEVIRQALVQLGVVVPVREGVCPACGLSQPISCREHGALDAATHSRGHLDGILCFEPRTPGQLPPGHRTDLGRPGHFATERVWGFEAKTIKKEILYKVPDMDEAFFRERWPDYWWQVQEYMRLTGLRQFIVLFIGLGNPWDLREYHVRYDPMAAMQIEAKYSAALVQAGVA